ncbi:glucan endo-1,3-beta-glucosidase 3 isoform X2 [Zea mays]|uniref:X8 domain-containing protein n=1 Tax=Zea mays TaxID=4577 RepID=A0A804QCL7_MAIZE|nr:glucan endo-1,3-beta-glucosidase 3 isoform X2 [Zea mays]|eukprot:XP_008653187.1 glucan endo-1,3-beta-glucosidase 3 isoform X2 [Zea mays]
MAFTLRLGTAFLVLLLFSCAAEAGEVGVNYGMVANDLPNPASVVQLLKQNGITMVKIYDANATVLTSLANTGIKAMVMMPNQNLAHAARDPVYAAQWVQDNVKKYLPRTQINAVAVGNEVFDDPNVDKMTLVPAMKNVQKALADLGLANAVKVSTPIAFSAVRDSFPPSGSRFRDDIAQPVMKPMLQLLQRTGSFLTVNIYPCLTQMQQPDDIPLDYALGNAQHAVLDGSNKYYSLLDAQLDATHYAMEALGFGNVEAVLGETGCPNKGKIGKHRPPRRGVGSSRRRLLDDGGSEPEASVANARAYNNYVINRVLSGNTGTPHRPRADMHVYIFALFNENNKSADPDDVENNFGLFYPNMQKIYDFNFRGGGGGGGQPPAGPAAASWCVANAAVGDDRLQQALDYACGHGADCSAIQPSGSCFEPDTKLAHASYAFDSYYQRNGRATSACDFSGAASIVYQAPAVTCSSAKPSWCVAKPGAGGAQLQQALDYACGHGADCSAIQSGGSCFQPDTVAAHASYAFNSYYQRNGRARVACDFSGAGSIVYQQPKVGNCVLPSNAG